jgi:carboxyl-terminal processing protease
MRIRIAALLAVLALVLAACSVSRTTVTSSTDAAPESSAAADDVRGEDGDASVSPAPVTSSTKGVGGVVVSISDCDSAEDGFAALCRSVELINERAVDEVPADTLVSGALLGIEEIETFEPTAASIEVLQCAVPSDAYAPICDAVAADVAAGDGSVDEVVAQAIQGMIEFGLEDPFGAYLSPQALELFSTNQSGAVEGIGALVQAREQGDETELCNLLSDTCRIFIVAPLDGSPAEAAGILAGDIIAAVNGTDVIGRTFDEVTAEVRGPAGSDVELTIERDGERLDVTVTRAAVEIPVTEARMLDDETGYLRLTSFTNNSAELLRSDLESLLEQGATSIIFDLQGNPGGSLNAAVLIASEFLEEGLVLRTEERSSGDDYEVVKGGVATDDAVELIVLVDGGSASASEVVTGALQEAGRAVVIGENTFGKNTVQRIWNLPDGGGLKLTIARWVTPDGEDYGLDGITPDVAVVIPVDATGEFLIDAALEYLGADGSV